MKKASSILFIFIYFLAIKINAQSPVPYEDRHSQIQSDAWISNNKTTSPNASRGVIHWIRYDLGDTYAIQKSKFWNVNVPGLTSAGVKTMIIDYSIDGIKWNEFGRYDMEIGNGSTLYEGEDGPNFSGLVARYILINITSNYGHATYAGLAELKFAVSPATVSDVDDNILNKFDIKVSPNPFSTNAVIEIKGISKFDNLYYQITDLSGKTIETKPVSNSIINYDSKNLSTGIYNFTLIHPSGIKSTQLNVVK
jgi:hypothetical protein